MNLYFLLISVGNITKNVFMMSTAVLFLVLEIRFWCHVFENKSITSTLAMVTEVKDCVSGEIFSVLPFNIGTTNFCSRDEDSLQQATG
jgi:hypothetical protein